MVRQSLLGILSFFATQNLVAQSDVTIIYYIAQEGAKEEEIGAAHELAENLFSQSESRIFFLPLGYRESIVAQHGLLNQVLDSLSFPFRTFPYPTIDVTADVKKFQSAMNDFERSENEKYLDASSGSIHLHFVIEGMADSGTLEKIQNNILVLNGWTVESGKLHAQISLSRWIWGEREKRMTATNPLDYE
jgi:hypothetical protein